MKLVRVHVVIASLLLIVTALLFCTDLYPRLSITVLSNVNPQRNEVSGGHLELRLTKLYDGIETFVLFIGHARSGHSLIGAILDAHPEIIIPHEYNLLAKWRNYKLESSIGLRTRVFFSLHALSRFQAMFGNRAETHRSDGKKYSYVVPGQWQGTYKDRLKVIGDKKGTATSHLLQNPNNFDILEDMRRTLSVKLKFIHVIRNPFDNIATKLLRRLGVRDMAEISTFKASNATFLDQIIDDFFAKVKSAERLKRYGKFEVLDVYSHEVISKPEKILQTLCNFLEISCYADFVESASKLLCTKPSLTRHSVAWTSKQKARIMNEINKYSFLKRFSFNSNY